MSGLWRAFGLAAAFAASLPEPALGASAAEPYYRAGVSLYTRKDFDRALRYFEAALKLDPSHAPSWVSAGNTAYHLRRYAEALRYYEGALERSPQDTRLRAFVERLRRSFASPATPKPHDPGAPPAGRRETEEPASPHFRKGVELYRAGRHLEAARELKFAAREKEDGRIFAYLAAAEEKGDRTREAVLHYRVAARLLSDERLEKRAAALEAGLDEWDREWVKEKFASGDLALDMPEPPGRFGLRVSSGLFLFGLREFEAEAERVQEDSRKDQTVEPSTRADVHVPPSALLFGISPFVRITPQVEAALRVEMHSLGTYSYEITDSTGRLDSASLEIRGAPALGLSVRYLFVEDGSERSQFYLGAEALRIPLEIRTEENRTNLPTDRLAGGNFKAPTVGLGFCTGIDFRLGGSAFLAPQVRLRIAKASNFHGGFRDSTTGREGEGTLMTYEDVNGRHVTVIPDDPAAFGVDPSAFEDLRPLELNLGGLELGLTLAVHF